MILKTEIKERAFFIRTLLGYYADLTTINEFNILICQLGPTPKRCIFSYTWEIIFLLFLFPRISDFFVNTGIPRVLYAIIIYTNYILVFKLLE